MLPKTVLSAVLTVFMVSVGLSNRIHHRPHLESTNRDMVPPSQKMGPPVPQTTPPPDYDVIFVDNYFRDYLAGPINDYFVLFTHDLISAYVGPPPVDHPRKTDRGLLKGRFTGRIRTWAMFDLKSGAVCELNAVHNWGMLALFSCPTAGVYQVYAYERNMNSVPMALPTVIESGHEYPTLTWLTKNQRKLFDLMQGPITADTLFDLHDPNRRKAYWTPEKRMEAIRDFTQYKRDKKQQVIVVTSDPVVVKTSHYCYTWMYSLTENARSGYEGNEVVLHIANGEAYIEYELLIWIAEPSSVIATEISGFTISRKLIISDYSKLITQRFSDTGIFPCLRQAHSVIEIIKEIFYVPSTDPLNKLDESPYWVATLRVHTNRLIGTLNDISFTIASRQYTASMHCFIADTRVFLSVREFDFVKQSILSFDSINLNISNIWPKTKKVVRHHLKVIYGHGVKFIGQKMSKAFQPSSTRTDAVIFTNPCHVQEFVLSVAGSMYIAEGLLSRGIVQARRIVLPRFDNPDGIALDPEDYREYIRIMDVAFTPTHVAFLQSDGLVLLHTTSAKLKGLAHLTSTQKYHPSAFVKRRWCPRTPSPKYTSMQLPLFSRSGSIILIQVYPVEGNVHLWIPPPSLSCKVEAKGFVQRFTAFDDVINETDIHYEEFTRVERSDHITGTKEPPPPPRPAPPPQPPRDLDAERTYLLSDPNNLDLKNPHYPPDMVNPAVHFLNDDMEHYNDAVIYQLEKDMATITVVLRENGLTSVQDEELGLYTVDFAAVEKQLIIAIRIVSQEVPDSFSAKSLVHPFQMVLTSMNILNYPTVPKVDRNIRLRDPKLKTSISFPGFILLRSKPFLLSTVKARDKSEDEENAKNVGGQFEVEFSPEVFTLNTAIPSYIINFGDIFVYSSMEGRYARPLNYYSWEQVHDRLRHDSTNLRRILEHNDSTILFKKEGILHDAVVTEQGIISVLWRKKKRHMVQDDRKCLLTDDSDTQTIAMGSVLSLEGLREVKPFFRNDNIFQRATPDGEVVYGIYETKPHSPFPSCQDMPPYLTQNDAEGCVEDADNKPVNNPSLPDTCAKGSQTPCLDVGFIQHCPAPSPFQPCLRPNSLQCASVGSRYTENFDKPHIDPNISNPNAECVPLLDNVTNCLPRYSPRESLRSANLLGTPFLSYLLGSLSSVKSIHPEAPSPPNVNVPSDISLEDEPSLEVTEFCPFSSFVLFHTEFDYADVGYKTRITGEVSYYGSTIPTEADLRVEYDRLMGVVVEISSAVEENRGLTTISKTIDIEFEMTDYTLRNMMETNISQGLGSRDFNDLRANEKASVFSITLRPSVINMRCRKADFFKTVQFNVGCNAFTTMRLLSEVSPLKQINWTEALDEDNTFKWIRDDEKKKLLIPVEHIFFQQVRENVFKCNNVTSGYCEIPYYELFGGEIFTISYRDHFFPIFEQFMTVSSRRIFGNIVLYDLLGSQQFNWTTNMLKAGCYGTGNKWYERLLASTKHIGTRSSQHEDIYAYYQDCFDAKIHQNRRELPGTLLHTPFHMHNLTNQNKIKFRRRRNQIFLFRALVVNTYYNRYTYCRLLDSFLMVRVTGIPIPRQELALWNYLLIFLSVCFAFSISYWFFYKFYTWKLDLGERTERTDEGVS